MYRKTPVEKPSQEWLEQCEAAEKEHGLTLVKFFGTSDKEAKKPEPKK